MKIFFQQIFYILESKKRDFFSCIFYYSFSSIFDLIVLSLLPILIAISTGSEIKNSSFLFKNLSKNYQTIYYVGAAILLITVLKSYINYRSIFRIVTYVSEVQRINRLKIFSFYKNIFLSDFSSSKLEKYLSMISYVVGVFSENVLFKVITVISEIFIILIICIYLSLINIYALIGLMFFFVTLLLAYFFLIKKFISIAGKKQSTSLEMLIEVINNVFKGLKEIKVLRLNNFFDKKFEYHNNQFTSNFISFQKLVFIPKYMLESIMITFIILLLFALSLLSEKSINYYFELIGVFLFASLRITPLAYNIFSSSSQIYSSKYSIKDIYREFKKIAFYKDSSISKINQSSVNFTIKDFNTLDFSKIYFSYLTNKKKFILKNVNFSILKGDCIGIKGDSGSGKTTLVNLLLGLLYPDRGKIIINRNIDAYSSDIFTKMSYTPQDFFLIKGNIIENIALGVNKKAIDYNKIFKVLKITQLDRSLGVNNINFKKNLTNRKIDTLSGGQAQRIAICRNFYFDREINVFDEFTSALDTKTEDNILRFLNTIKGRNTIIIISHRLNALKYCNKIYEIENGSLVKKKFV